MSMQNEGRRMGFDPDELREVARRNDRRLPNLFIIGAPRSGTSSLHYFLGEHPSVFMTELKEPGFFVPELNTHPKDPEWYVDLFGRAQQEEFVGESSTHYSKLPTYRGVPERIAESCESPRFIYLMRDPVDRAISHYWHSTRQSAEFRSPLKAVEENIEYRAFGEYYRQLEPYFETFGRDSVYAETFERLISNPREVTSEIYRWLGLDPTSVSVDFPRRNATPGQIDRFEVSQSLGEFLHHSRLWDHLSGLIPRSVKDLGRRITQRTVDPSDAEMDHVRKFLSPWARDVADRTGSLLGRTFPEWSAANSE